MSETMDRTTNILLVDDDEVCRINVRRAFDKGKLTNPLFHAEDGLQALEILRGDVLPRDRRLVLLDMHMPRMNGLEFLRALRSDPEIHATPVVMLTASEDHRDRAEAYRLNVAGYLIKPVRLGAFVELMTALNRYWTLMEMP